MTALGLGAPEDFPFVDAPDTRMLNDGYRLLAGARRGGTATGASPASGGRWRALPSTRDSRANPRRGGPAACLARAGDRRVLSIQDPRERPAERTGRPTRRTRNSADQRSDFVAVLNLWAAARAAADGGQRALRRWCREHFLSFMRMREWQDLHRAARGDSPRAAARVQLGPGPLNLLHQAILSGFLGGIAVLEEGRTYLGARDVRS